MSSLNWIRKLFSSSKNRGQINTKARTFQPRYEVLEDRVVPAVPTLANLSYGVHQGQVLNVSTANGIFAQDSDPGLSVTPSMQSYPMHGYVMVNNDGSFYYSPNSGYVGSDSFSLKATDGTNYSNTATITLNVNNSAPTASDKSYSVHAGQMLNVSAANGLKVGASDADGDQLSVVSMPMPSHGMAMVMSDGSFYYTPNTGYVGNDTFTYSVFDGAEYSATKTVTISVTNTAPTATDKTYSVHSGNMLNVSSGTGLLSGAGDADGDNLTASMGATSPGHGYVMIMSDGSFTYSPNTHYVGADSFTYKVYDGTLYSAEKTVTINVTDAAPTAINHSYDVVTGQSLSVPANGVLGGASDADGDSLTASMGTSPTHGYVMLMSDGSFYYTPNSGYTGSDSFTFTVSDGTLSSSAKTVSINVLHRTLVWDGGGAANLASDAMNWVGDIAPTAGDNIIFNSTSVKNATLDTLAPNTFGSVTIASGYSGEITFGQSITVTSSLGQDSGTVTLGYNHLTIAGGATYTMSAGNLNGPGYLEIAGTVTWTGGSWDPATANIQQSGDLNISPTSTVSLIGWTINVDGELNWTKGDVLNSDSTVNVNEGGVFNVSSGGIWKDAPEDGLSVISVAGLLCTTGGDSETPTSIEAEVEITGTLQADSGSLGLKNGGTFNGNLYVATTAEVVLVQGNFIAQNINAPAPPALHYRSLVVGANGMSAGLTAGQGTQIAIDRLTLRAGGTLDGAGEFRIAQQWNWAGGAMSGAGTTTNNAGSVLTVSGNVTSSRNISNKGVAGITDGNTLTVNCTLDNYGVLTLVGTASIVTTSAATLNNRTTLDNLGRKDTVAELNKIEDGVATIGVVVQQDAQLNVAKGTLTLNASNGFSANSQTAINGLATLALAPAPGGPRPTSAFAPGALMLGQGVLTTSGATVSIGAGEDLVVTDLQATGPGVTIITGAGELTTGSLSCIATAFTGSLTVHIGVGRSMTIGAGCAITQDVVIDNTGTVNWVGAGTLAMGDSAQIVNDGVGGQGIFSIQTTGPMVEASTAPGFMGPTDTVLMAKNGGLISVDLGGGGNAIGSSVRNAGGTLDLNGESLSLAKVYEPVGGDTNLSGGTLTIAGAFNQTGGTTRLGGGIVNVELTQIVGGVWEGGGTVNGNVVNSGTVRFSSDGPGLLSINGNFTQTALGAIQATISDEDPPTLLSVTGDVVLDGALNAFLENYVPGAGELFTIMMYGGQKTGAFATSQGVGNNVNWSITYGPGSVVKLQS
jgi:hypothetical protein